MKSSRSSKKKAGTDKAVDLAPVGAKTNLTVLHLTAESWEKPLLVKSMFVAAKKETHDEGSASGLFCGDNSSGGKDVWFENR